jgi:hypothetical protein
MHHYRSIPKDHGYQGAVLADRDDRPAFVALELRKREAVRYSQGVLVLRGNRAPGCHGGERHASD